MKSTSTVEFTTAADLAMRLIELAWSRIPSSEFPPSEATQKLIAKSAASQAAFIEQEIEERDL